MMNNSILAIKDFVLDSMVCPSTIFFRKKVGGNEVIFSHNKDNNIFVCHPCSFLEKGIYTIDNTLNLTPDHNVIIPCLIKEKKETTCFREINKKEKKILSLDLEKETIPVSTPYLRHDVYNYVVNKKILWYYNQEDNIQKKIIIKNNKLSGIAKIHQKERTCFEANVFPESIKEKTIYLPISPFPFLPLTIRENNDFFFLENVNKKIILNKKECHDCI